MSHQPFTRKVQSRLSVIYLPIETKSREMDSRLLIGQLLAKAGYSVILGQPSVLEKHALKVPGVYLHNRHTKGDEELVSRLTLAGNRVAAIDEEALHQDDPDFWVENGTGPETLNLLARVFTNNLGQFESMQGAYPFLKESLIHSGNPRLEILAPGFSRLRGASRPRKMPENFVLVNTTFAAGNISKTYGGSYVQHISHILESVEVSDAVRRKWLAEASALVSHDRELLCHYVSALKKLSKSFPEAKFVLRPHPSESLSRWKRELKGLRNVVVRNSGPSYIWIENSMGMIHPGCTTALEASKLSRPALFFKPKLAIYGPNYGSPEAFSAFGKRIFDEIELIEAVKEVLRQRFLEHNALSRSANPRNQVVNSARIIAKELSIVARQVTNTEFQLFLKTRLSLLSARAEISGLLRLTSNFVRLYLRTSIATKDLGSNLKKFPWTSGSFVRRKMEIINSITSQDIEKSEETVRATAVGPRVFILAAGRDPLRR